MTYSGLTEMMACHTCLALALLAASAATSAPAAAPVQIKTDALKATGTGDTEKPFSMKIRTGALSATGMGAPEPVFKPVHIRTDTLSAIGQVAAPTGGKK